METTSTRGLLLLGYTRGAKHHDREMAKSASQTSGSHLKLGLEVIELQARWYSLNILSSSFKILF